MKSFLCSFLIITSLGVPVVVQAAFFSEQDSTQPRGDVDAVGAVNADGQPLDPVNEGFRAPARSAAGLPDEEPNHFFYHDSMGTMMTWSGRDPAFFAELASSNHDIIEFINSLDGDPNDPTSELGVFLSTAGLFGEISRDGAGRLQPEEKLPVVADICLRCHFPVGWLEGRSEPPTAISQFLKGQFWGAAFLEEPVDSMGIPRPVNLSMESEAEMDGVQCDFCHRSYDNAKRVSNFDHSSILAGGNGGFFVTKDNPFGLDMTAKPKRRSGGDFQKTSDFCGTCHDVTNPIIKTKTVVNSVVPDILHPIERTYTEWYWSGYREEGTGCESCHTPMKFQGAQTWLLYPGLDTLWEDVDRKWFDRGFMVDPYRTEALKDGRNRNKKFMRKAARLDVTAAKKVDPGQPVTLTVKVTNLTGHKLPTGFAEGRQMWLYIRAADKEDANVFFENGALDVDGNLAPGVTKVYERIGSAEGYAPSVVTPGEEHFRFALENTVEKDNRIPPRGYNKAAYQADGAFIIPEDSYADGQYWDETSYTFTIPANVREKVIVTVELRYQTFNTDYMKFLREHGDEPTQANGGRARNLPATAFVAANGLEDWGETIYQVWKQEGGKGTFVLVKRKKVEIGLR